jgi:hypothetical protein
MLRIVLASGVLLKLAGFCFLCALLPLTILGNSHSACRLQPQLHGAAARVVGEELDVDDHFDGSTEARTELTFYDFSSIDPIVAV